MALPNLRCLISRENVHQIGTLFFLHGEGYTPESSRKLLKSLLHREFEFDHVRVIYPQAPDITYRVATGGEEKGMWYERNTFSPTDWEKIDSINHSCTLISQLINLEKSRGIPSQNIIVGGFGMGGIIAIHTAYRFHPEIAGVFTHSSILSPRSIVLETIRTDLQFNKDKKFPALWMWYGRKDKNWLRWAVHTAECFMDLKIQTNFQVNYAMQGHEIISDEVNYLKEWVEQIIPNPGRGTEKETS